MGLFQPHVGHRDCDGKTHLTAIDRSITVINPAQAAAALSAAAATGHPATLLSAPDAAASVGAAWFAALIDDAASSFPGVMVTAILDCGDAAGLALVALRLGHRAICYNGAALNQVRDIARQYGASVLTARPDSLDLETIAASGGDIQASGTGLRTRSGGSRGGSCGAGSRR
mgnify:CR=1 FL=1